MSRRGSSSGDVCLYFLAIFLPPLAVLLKVGCGADVLINLCLDFLGWIPGVLHAWYVIAKNTRWERRGLRGGPGPRHGEHGRHDAAPPPQGYYPQPPAQGQYLPPPQQQHFVPAPPSQGYPQPQPPLPPPPGYTPREAKGY